MEKIRKIDDLERIVIPKEIRRILHIREGDTLKLNLEGTKICITKHCTKKDYAEMLNSIVNDISCDDTLDVVEKRALTRSIDNTIGLLGYEAEETDNE